MRRRLKSPMLICTVSLMGLAVPTTIVKAQGRSGDVYTDSTFDSNKWPTTLLICSRINDIFRSKIAKNPSLGTLPIIIRKAPDATPRIDLRGLPNAYWVNLTAPDSNYWCQIVYQAGHEFGHIWVNPRVEGSWFVESACVAVSHVALEEMAKEWKSHTRQAFVAYALKLRRL